MSTLTASHLGKTFPGVVALDDVSIEVQGGTVHALVGANGAGKSTLIKILTGYYPEYAGEIAIDDVRMDIRRPADAIGHGIQVVHQEVDTALIPYLTAAENLFVEQLAQDRTFNFIRWRKLYDAATAAARRVGLTIDVRTRVEDLSLHEKQLLLIARALSQDVRFLILDEPSASLSLREVERLFEVLRTLRAEGVGIIYISHRLAEVRTIADEITVLRNGREVAHYPTAATDLNQIVEDMLGVEPADAFPPRRPLEAGEVILEASGLTRHGAVNAVDLTVRRGEILGVAGLVGAGKTELLRLLYGADEADAGEIRIDGRVRKVRRPHQAVAQDIFLVPEERRTQGLIVEDRVRENLVMPFLPLYSAFGFVRRQLEKRQALAAIDRVGLTPRDPEMPVENLSGGNQQKVVVGKWFGRPPRVMLFDEATQGIDVKAKRDVYDLVQEISAEAGVIYASSDIDEVLALADRVLVMRAGAVVADVMATEITRREALALATGAEDDKVSG